MLKVKEYFFNTFYKYFAMQFSEGRSGWVAIIFGISIFLYELGVEKHSLRKCGADTCFIKKKTVMQKKYFVKKFVKNKQNQIDKAS